MPLPHLLGVDENVGGPGLRVDTSVRDASGEYERHILATEKPPDGMDLRKFLSAA